MPNPAVWVKIDKLPSNKDLGLLLGSYPLSMASLNKMSIEDVYSIVAASEKYMSKKNKKSTNDLLSGFQALKAILVKNDEL